MADHPVLAGLRWIIANRKDSAGKKLFNPTTLSRAAGLSRSHVGGILAGNQTPNIERDTAVKLARAAGVRTAWLLTGNGPREPFEEDEIEEAEPPRRDDDPCIPRAQYFEIARRRGADEGVLAALRRAEVPKGAHGEPTTVEYWHGEYVRLKRLANRFEPDFRSVGDELDDQPVGETPDPK